jgi:hypothetical protein
MPQNFGRNAEFDHARAELARLTIPGILGFYTHFEVTEIFAIRDGEDRPFNVFSILVAEEHDDATDKKPFYLGDRIRLKSIKGCMLGVKRCLRPTSEVASAFEHFQQAEEWQPSGKPLRVGPLIPLPTQFVPADSTESAPWNNVLKNNFWNGSYIIEWVDPQKTDVKSLFDAPPSLQELSEVIQRQVPIRLASLSDRLGNVIVQIPVTILIASFVKARAGDVSVHVGWHPKAISRPLRASSEMRFDNIISAYSPGDLTGPEVTLPMGDAQGTLRSMLWDDQNHVILAATASTGFYDSIGWDMRTPDPEPRVFTIRQQDGTEETIRVGLAISRFNEVKVPAPDRGEKWTRRRIYRDEVARLTQSRRFVQYNPAPGQQDVEHHKALEDIRALVNQYGEKGACLWDPYLSADDILRTLFYCSHYNAILRALTAGQEPSGSIPTPSPQPTFAEKQRAVFVAARSNFRGLRLEYRIKTGSAGWSFHDRFLIFPGEEGEGALAWALGTSVNSLGKRHHILQQVDNGQLVMDAFNSLWDELDQPDHLIWRIP